jgi:hypothetical protein
MVLSYIYTGVHVKYALSCQILTESEFSEQTCDIPITNFVKIRPVGAELFQEDGQT